MRLGYKIQDRKMLPRSMYEALVEADNSDFLKRTLGEKLFNNYLSLKLREWETFRTSVTTMEHAAYLAI